MTVERGRRPAVQEQPWRSRRSRASRAENSARPSTRRSRSSPASARVSSASPAASCRCAATWRQPQPARRAAASASRSAAAPPASRPAGSEVAPAPSRSGPAAARRDSAPSHAAAAPLRRGRRGQQQQRQQRRDHGRQPQADSASRMCGGGSAVARTGGSSGRVMRGPAGAAGLRRRHSGHRPGSGSRDGRNAPALMRPAGARGSSSQVRPAAPNGPAPARRWSAGSPAGSTAIHQPLAAVLRLSSGAATSPVGAAGPPRTTAQ